MPRSPLTETIKRVDGMIAYVRENLSDDEYQLFLDLLVPESEPVKKPQKKSSKKAAGKGGGKSARASGMAQQLSGRRQQQTVIVHCVAVVNDQECGEPEESGIHDPTMGYRNYHEFQPGKSTAPTVTNPSSANGGATGSTRNSEASEAGVSTATGG